MSCEATCTTKISDKDVLAEILKEIFGYGKVKYMEEGIPVSGYFSKNKPQLIIDDQSLYGTAGYYLESDGTWSLVYDTMDKHKLSSIIPYEKNGIRHDEVSKRYSIRMVKRALEEIGASLVDEIETKEGGSKLKVRLSD